MKFLNTGKFLTTGKFLDARKLFATSLHKRRATGICVGESRVLVAVAAGSARAAEQIDAFEVPVGRGGPLEALTTLAGDPRLAGTIALGFDPRREFNDTLHLAPEESARSVEELLEARLGRIQGGLVGAMRLLELPDLLRVARAPRGRWVAVSAVPKQFAVAARAAFASRASDPVLLLPVAHELHRAAARLTRAPRGWRNTIRVLPSGRRGMAILSSGRKPLAWRLFPWSEADPVGSIGAAARMLSSHARQELGIEAIDGLLVHGAPGREDIANACGEKLGLPALSGAPMVFDESAIALALAGGALAHAPGDLDLFDERPLPTAARKRLPAVKVALLGALVIVPAAIWGGWSSFRGASGDGSEHDAAREATLGGETTDAPSTAGEEHRDPLPDVGRAPRRAARKLAAVLPHVLSLDSTLIAPECTQALISGRTVVVGSPIDGIDPDSPPVLAWVEGVRAGVRYRSREYVMDLDHGRRVTLDAPPAPPEPTEPTPDGDESGAAEKPESADAGAAEVHREAGR